MSAAQLTRMALLSPKERYIAYLSSNHWVKLRLSVRRRAKYLCEACGRSRERNPEAHHLHYGEGGDWFDVSKYDVIALCSVCHEKAHSPAILAAVNALPRGALRMKAIKRLLTYAAPYTPIPSTNRDRMAMLRSSRRRFV